MSGGNHPNGGPPHIGSLNPNFMANKSFESQGGGGQGLYYNNTVPTHVNGE